MFVKDLTKDFYQVVAGKQCLILVNFDVDGICASKILQSLFKNDNVVYTLVPVQGVKDLKSAYDDNAEDIEYVVLVNCGGNIDLIEILQPEETVTFFILDSHRPYDLKNVYNEKQIKLLGDPTLEEAIPEYDVVFNDESSDEEDEEEFSDNEEESAQNRRLRQHEARINKKIKRREWEEKREEALFHYEQLSYYAKSSAVIAYEMSWQMSRDNLDMVWWAIIGSTEQAILNKVESSTSVLESGNLQSHVSRLTHARGGNIDKQQLSAIKVTYDKDLRLALYRHWTVEDSLKHSLPTAVALRLWSIKGQHRMRELLAEMGLPLCQSKQKFSSMDLTLRNEFKDMIEKLSDKYKIRSIVSGDFTMQYGYRFKYCATDIVYAMLAILESTGRDRPPQLCFLEASDCLSRMKKEILEKGIEKAKIMLGYVFKAAQSLLELKQVTNAGNFLYVVISEGMLHHHLFAHPHMLLMLAQFILRAYAESTRSRKTATLPLVASATFSEEEGTCLIVGVPPVLEEQPRSFFGKAFSQAAENTNSFIDQDYFDVTMARLKSEDRPKFFDALSALLQ
ncbi:cell division control protein 45 homolog [Trichogramma pretiosum]|uniref:cell division control protein 45 homolog n=1 Tax=Trichogramma pretiosum TaxID=7493 RepID=UPI0006C98A76|nr:cell division control protein 45 homolog [Trichogramma pretiosum]